MSSYCSIYLFKMKLMQVIMSHNWWHKWPVVLNCVDMFNLKIEMMGCWNSSHGSQELRTRSRQLPLASKLGFPTQEVTICFLFKCIHGFRIIQNGWKRFPFSGLLHYAVSKHAQAKLLNHTKEPRLLWGLLGYYILFGLWRHHYSIQVLFLAASSHLLCWLSGTMVLLGMVWCQLT